MDRILGVSPPPFLLLLLLRPQFCAGLSRKKGGGEEEEERAKAAFAESVSYYVASALFLQRWFVCSAGQRIASRGRVGRGGGVQTVQSRGSAREKRCLFRPPPFGREGEGRGSRRWNANQKKPLALKLFSIRKGRDEKNKNKLCSMTCGRVPANGTIKKNLCIKEGVPLHFEILV